MEDSYEMIDSSQRYSSQQWDVPGCITSDEVIDRIEGDATIWEQDPLRSLAADGQLTAYHHAGFWQPMDTLRDRLHLEELWAQAKAPWKVW